MFSSQVDACAQANFLLNSELRKGKLGVELEKQGMNCCFESPEPGQMTWNFSGPERFSENAMDVWLAVRNFFCAPWSDRFDRFGGFATAWMFNKNRKFTKRLNFVRFLLSMPFNVAFSRSQHTPDQQQGAGPNRTQA
jgi:hypothetical protein